MKCESCGTDYPNGPVPVGLVSAYVFKYQKEHYRVLNSRDEVVQEYDDEVLAGIVSCPVCADRQVH